MYIPRKSDIDALLDQIEEDTMRIVREQTDINHAHNLYLDMLRLDQQERNREQMEEMRLAELERRCGTEDPDYE